ncbi:MAG: glycosyltransferase [Gammaproteobacteria bacterium]|jgi:undecaprenyl-phosphate 4-deoxy-4-formamido-L-arabinose transferase|nr:glycosyltransferase [Gammaproteobacteria bacterium]|tara:strand:+ start:22556 stop:23491 length:936 start_codon:yes stop_codon:yes gene_type:complete
MLISIVIPVYNSEDTIDKLVEKLVTILNDLNVQIVLINDDSSDNSHSVCLNLYSRYSSIVTYVNLSKNFGEHNAVMAGLNHANGDYVVIIDDDFQNPPEEVIKLVNEASENGYDIVYSYYKRKKHSWYRNMVSMFNNWIADFMLDKPKGLYLSSFKCLSRFVVQEIIKYRGPFPYIDGLALRCSRNIGKIEVRHSERKAGKSGYTLKKMLRLWLNMLLNFSIIPLRIASLLGLFFSLLGVILSIVVVIEKLFLIPNIPLGWPSMAIAILIFSGVQLLILGFIGEYLGHLYLSSNQTPQFIIREVHQDKNKK